VQRELVGEQLPASPAQSSTGSSKNTV
jgi:hypothetical protein